MKIFSYDNLVTVLTKIQTKINTVLSSAEAAQSTANTALTNAATAQSAAEAAQSTANDNATDISTLQNTVSTNTNNIATNATAISELNEKVTANVLKLLSTKTSTKGTYSIDISDYRSGLVIVLSRPDGTTDIYAALYVYTVYNQETFSLMTENSYSTSSGIPTISYSDGTISITASAFGAWLSVYFIGS